MPKNPQSPIPDPKLEQLAALITAKLIANGEYLHIIDKTGKHIGTWLKFNVTIAISNLLHQHIELNTTKEIQ